MYSSVFCQTENYYKEQLYIFVPFMKQA